MLNSKTPKNQVGSFRLALLISIILVVAINRTYLWNSIKSFFSNY